MDVDNFDQGKNLYSLQTAIIELPRIDAEELREQLPAGAIEIEAYTGSSAVAHDMLTVLAIVLITREALRILAMLVVRQLSRKRTSINITRKKPDGSEETITFSNNETDVLSHQTVLEVLEKAFNLQNDSSISNLVKDEIKNNQ